MKEKVINHILTGLSILAVFTVGYLLGQSPFAPVHIFGPLADTPSDAREAFEPFWETWQLLHQAYFDQPLDDAVLAEGAIEGMLATLGDANTIYLSPEAEAAERESIQGQFQGVGMQISQEDGQIVVVAPFEGSPAAKAGIQAGDVILAADGVTLTGMDSASAAALVRGPAGTTVILTVERGSERFDLPVERGVITVPSVRGEMLPQNIAYVRLSQFGDETAVELANTLESLLGANPAGLILDMRGNPGGNLLTAVDVADQFLNGGLILTERFGDGSEHTFEADDEGMAQEIPMVVLLDEGSASASEVVAGALRDRDRAIIVGQRSFGKGTVQTWRSLSNGGGVRITIARWLTPDGDWVHGEGLEPDIAVTLPATEAGTEFVDIQLEAAVDYLLSNQ